MTLENQREEVFVSLQEYIVKYIDGLKEIIDWFHQGDEQKALEAMVDAVEGLKWISEALTLTKELHGISMEADKINPLLVDINTGLERSDTILIADILEYEIVPLINEWNDQINKMFN